MITTVILHRKERARKDYPMQYSGRTHTAGTPDSCACCPLQPPEKIHPHRQKCGVQLEEKKGMIFGYTWRCVSCGFRKRSRDIFFTEGGRAEKIWRESRCSSNCCNDGCYSSDSKRVTGWNPGGWGTFFPFFALEKSFDSNYDALMGVEEH
jgi:hypothetical protein